MVKPKVSFWIISVIALLWNLMGVNQYLIMAFKTESFKEMYTPEKLAIVEATPVWATAAFAIAVFAAAFGCIALLLRKKIATPLFLISFLAIIVQNIDSIIRIDFSIFNSFEKIMHAMILIVGLFLIWYSKFAYRKGWIK